MVDKVTKKLNLNDVGFSDVPVRRRSSVKNQIGEFIINESLRMISSGRSPVKGIEFAKLNAEYAQREKGGDRTPNLELEGDLLDAYTFRSDNRLDEFIEIGVFEGSGEVPKADGHNNHSGDSDLPVRRFVPLEKEEYKQPIVNGIKQIIRENRTPEVRRRNQRVRQTDERGFENLSTFLSPSGVDAILDRIFGES